MKNTPLPNWEKILLIILIVSSVIHFSNWGTQTVKHVLGVFFGTPLPDTTFLDPFIGIIALAASILIFLGSILRWHRKLLSLVFVMWGTGLFAAKAVFDILNEILIVKQTSQNVSIAQIEELAADIGSTLLLLAFWAIVFVYYLREGRKKELA